jgi:hypothetical protein
MPRIETRVAVVAGVVVLALAARVIAEPPVVATLLDAVPAPRCPDCTVSTHLKVKVLVVLKACDFAAAPASVPSSVASIQGGY